MSTSATWRVIRRVDCTDQGRELSLRAIALVYPVVLYLRMAAMLGPVAALFNSHRFDFHKG